MLDFKIKFHHLTIKTNFKFLIKCNLICGSLSCIYYIKCQMVLKMYIGETETYNNYAIMYDRQQSTL